MYKRTLTPPNRSFFLFGPRATGKTTWLNSSLPADSTLTFDLLLEEAFLPLVRDQKYFRDKIEGSQAEWIFVDEVQKIPSLLNQVHHLIQKHGSRYKFALSGSSARKLKRLNSNLLAGRVIRREFFPLTAREQGKDFLLERALSVGNLPGVLMDPKYSVDILESYVHTYLAQEIHQETLVRDIEPFARFLKIAAIMNGEILNVSNIARDAAIGRTTAERYFSILVDTLMGVFVQPWRSRVRVKEIAHPKFYLFDTGVARGMTGRLREKVDGMERGALMEALTLHEIRAWASYSNSGGEVFFWRTPGGAEVDFIWSRGSNHVGVEVKASASWRREWGTALKELLAMKKLKRGFGVYGGQEVLKDGPLTILPFQTFAYRLYEGLFED